MKTTFATERLILHPTTAEHFSALHELYRNAETMRFMPSIPHTSLVQTAAEISQDMSLKGAHHWTVFLKATDEIIGMVNFLGETAIPGMGYLMKRAFWNQGYATEACRPVLAFGFETLMYDRIELWINQDNQASQRVAQKLNFKLKGRIPQRYAHETQEHVMLIYGLWQEEWQGKIHLRTMPEVYRIEPVLHVHNINESVAFYHEKLGFNIDFVFGAPPNHAGVSYGDWTGVKATLQLSRIPADQQIHPSGYLHFFTDAGLDRLFERMAQQGVTVIATPQDHPWGMREFEIADNNGHHLRFGTHI